MKRAFECDVWMSLIKLKCGEKCYKLLEDCQKFIFWNTLLFIIALIYGVVGLIACWKENRRAFLFEIFKNFSASTVTHMITVTLL